MFYEIQPSRANAQSLALGDPVAQKGLGQTGIVLLEAHRLTDLYGSRPKWHLSPFKKGEVVPAALAPQVISYLVACESQCVSVKHLDSNNAYSYGILQIQSSTWADFEARSGIHGDAMNPEDAITMGLWAVEHGYLYKWSCAKLTGILK